MIEFEWDESKTRANIGKHCVAFDEAATVFSDPLGVTIFDPGHSEEEDRFLTIGCATMGRLLIVSHADRGARIRIISAREPTRKERKAYENEIQRRKR